MTEPMKPLPSDREIIFMNAPTPFPRIQEYTQGFNDGMIKMRDEYAAPAYAEVERLKAEIKILDVCNNANAQCAHDYRVKLFELQRQNSLKGAVVEASNDFCSGKIGSINLAKAVDAYLAALKEAEVKP
jgi:hypothetical protein